MSVTDRYIKEFGPDVLAGYHWKVGESLIVRSKCLAEDSEGRARLRVLLTTSDGEEIGLDDSFVWFDPEDCVGDNEEVLCATFPNVPREALIARLRACTEGGAVASDRKQRVEVPA